MTSGSQGHDLIEKYQTYLESRIEKGDRSLVCRGEKFCKEVEVLLTKGNAPKILNLCGIELLTVIQKSLQAFPFKTGYVGVEKISKAFEVLELAALNLYLYPWRKEYKSVKMFSGMFTHCIKPALTLQQAKELFGLLGYQPVSHYEEEELVLNSILVPADFILCLACAFFTARMECQLLLSTSGSVDTSVKSVLQLVQERQKGHSLRLALENTREKMEASHALHAKPTCATDPELDLYTDEHMPQAGASHTTYSSSAPSRSSYMQPNDSSVYRDSSYRLNSENTSQERALCVSMHQCQISNSKTHVSLPQNAGLMESLLKDQMATDTKKHTAEVEQLMCTCSKSSLLFLFYCEQCNHFHSPDCSYYDYCKSKKHNIEPCPDEKQQRTDVQHSIAEDQPKQGKDDFLKKHYCMCNSTSDTFLVCHSCQLIHDWNCRNIKTCKVLHHNLQPTGVIQPPQEDTPKRHFCLSSESLDFVVCNTCNSAHDCLCTYVQACLTQQHDVLCHQTFGETDNIPIKYHQCCIAEQPFPEIACLTCNVFHASTCTDRWQCSKNHKIHHLGTKCVTCNSRKIHTLCRYCFLLYCKDCWYKDPILCKCGRPLDSFDCSPV